jgi:hypothetical protein
MENARQYGVTSSKDRERRKTNPRSQILLYLINQRMENIRAILNSMGLFVEN